MKYINNIFLKTFYESFSFILPQNIQHNHFIVNSKFKFWNLIDTYQYSYNLKLIIKILNNIFLNHTNKHKILFICDDNILCLLKNDLLCKNSFYTTNLKKALDFLQRTKLSNHISVIIYIGNNNEMSKKILTQLKCPVIFFTMKTKGGFDFYNPNMLSFHSSILFLKTLLIEALTLANQKLYE